MIRFEGVNVTYPNKTQVQLGSFTIPEGACLVVAGPSGSGKSSFLRLVNGLIPEYYPAHIAGQATLADLELGKTEVETLSQKVTTVSQQVSSQFFHRYVLDELVFPCENMGLDREEIQKRLKDVAEQFNLTELLDKEIRDLSGGQQQRLALALAKMQDTPVILCDEPTANLDDDGVKMVGQFLMQESKAGKTLIVAEHRLDYLASIATHYLYVSPSGCQLYDLIQWQALSDDDLIAMGLRPNEPRDLTVPIYASNKADLQVQHRQGTLAFLKGNIIGIVGKNGVGKSYLALTIAGLEKNKDQVLWQGQPMKAKDRRIKTSMVMQDVRRQLFRPTVEQEIMLGNSQRENLEKVINPLGLSDLMARHPLSLSGGQQQRVLVASSLLADKDWLIFDEPSSGLDYRYMQALSELIQTLKADHRIVLLISHDKALLNQTCDLILRLD